MNKETSAIVEKIRIALEKEFDASEIYLFGSYVWGEPNKDSDLDILVLLNESDESRLKRAQRAYRSLRGLMRNIPTDIIVRTKKEIDSYKNDTNSIYYKILKNGKKLYATK
jgi:predicted nucleotidyltransferase